jgi:hypothetical protein
LGGLVLISLIVVSIFECAYGGTKATFYGGTKATLFLAASKLLLFAAYYFTPPDKSLQSNIVFHIRRTFCVAFVLVSFEYARSESPCFAQEAESQISTFVFPTLAASVLLGWTVNALTASKNGVAADEDLTKLNPDGFYGSTSIVSREQKYDILFVWLIITHFLMKISLISAPFACSLRLCF